jgi:hypothetical protein
MVKKKEKLITEKSSSNDSKKEKRYCKGCLADVTESMFCHCGEFNLTKGCTYTDDDLKEININ